MNHSNTLLTVNMMTFNANFLRGHPSTIIFHNKKISHRRNDYHDDPIRPSQTIRLCLSTTRWRRLEVSQVTDKSGHLATVNEFPIVLSCHIRHFFSDAIELTEMQHFSFYKFKLEMCLSQFLS